MQAARTEAAMLLERVRDRAAEAGVFGEITLEGSRLSCAAADSAEPAFYRVEVEDGGVFVSLVTADRWLSESIESELMHMRDSLVELLDEELAELGYEGPEIGFSHYRSEDLLYTFRSQVPVDGPEADGAGETTALVLLGYEAVFRELGDMSGGGDED